MLFYEDVKCGCYYSGRVRQYHGNVSSRSSPIVFFVPVGIYERTDVTRDAKLMRNKFPN